MSPPIIRCDIFCTVVDNFGDAGVCWRLARQVASEFGWKVRLLIDDDSMLRWLAPDRANTSVEIADFRSAPYRDAEVLIEAFACDIPVAYQAAMAGSPTSPVWLNLEYLSAESWVGGSHGLPSIHPHLGLSKHFFFPGFDPDSGGLIRESDYDHRRRQFDVRKFRLQHSFPEITQNALLVSVFAYPDAPCDALYAAWSTSPVPVLAVVPGCNAQPRTSGSLRVLPIPYLSQLEYDELLWACDLNFVRGEDSFVRGQWASKPMVWQIYPQDDDAHWVKLESFMARYSPVGAGETPSAKFWRAWNGRGVLDWPSFAQTLAVQGQRAAAWADDLRQHHDLATNLRDFCLRQLKLG